MKVLYKDVADNCTGIHSIACKMKQLIDDTTKSNETLPKDWSGDASAFYQSKLTDLMSNFEESYRELEYTVLFLAKQAGGYQNLENKIITEVCANLGIAEPNLLDSKIFSQFEE